MKNTGRYCAHCINERALKTHLYSWLQLIDGQMVEVTGCYECGHYEVESIGARP